MCASAIGPSIRGLPAAALIYYYVSTEDNDMESERFHPMTSNNQMTESFTSSVSSMSTSMTSSVNLPTAQPRIKRNKKGYRFT